MINVSTAFKRALANDQRNYIERVVITLSDGATLELSNANIWESGFSIEDAVSSDNSFDVGAAIINKANLTINNIYDDFSAYDFNKAKVVMYVGLDLDGTEEVFKRGTFIVDEASYDGAIIKLSCLDYMSKFDIPYSNSKLGYPATLDQIVRNACSICDVSLNTYDFPHKDYVVQTRPAEETTTFREVISWAAQIAGCYCRCNVNGALELKWYDQASLEQQYSTLDGGYFDGGRGGFSRLANYLNTTDGMSVIVDGVRQYDETFILSGVDWFTFDGNVTSTIYVNSNSWVNLGKTPSSSGPSSTGQLNILRRDGQMHYLYRQEGSIDGLRFLKIRFEGYTQYQTASAVDAYANKWELFLLGDGNMVINMIQTPTVATSLGTSSLIAGSQTLALSLADGKGRAPIVGLNYSGGIWSESSTKYLSGDIADGGSFNPWDAGYTADSNSFESQASVHNIYSVYGMNISTDNVVITGVRISVKVKDKDNNDTIKTYMRGTDGYVIGIEENPLITTSTAQSIANWLGIQLIGFRFRKATVNHSSDPTIEAGDVAILFDRKNRSYPFVVSETKFSIGNSQTTSANAETPAKNSASRYSAETKNYLALRQQIIDEKTDREQALDDLAEQINETSQMYITKEESDGVLTAIVIHNKEIIKESDIVWKITTNAFGVSTDGGKTYNFGATADGDLITRVLSTVGINANWINSGIISANRIRGGELIVGGQNNTNGTLKVLDSSGTRVGYWDNGGIYIGNIASGFLSPNTRIAHNGAISTKSLTASDYIKVDGNSNSIIKMPFSSDANSYVQISKTGFLAKMNGGYVFRVDNLGVTSYDSSKPSTTSLYCGMTPHGIDLYDRVISSSKLDIMSHSLDFYDIKSSGFTTQSSFGKKNTSITGSLKVKGSKSRVVDTNDYGDRILYCYETTSPLFGDVGEGVISEDGKCYIQIDEVFAETVSLNQYQVFLQNYGDGDCWIKERRRSYFVVEGTPNLSFGWELKAKQVDFDQFRIDKDVGDITKINRQKDDLEIDYASELFNHINKLSQERNVQP